MSIIKPTFDIRDFKANKLENNIKYVVIKDITLDRSYISVNVKAGSFNEMLLQKDIGGLAHFLEHMLFMGSEKYPNENYFTEKLTSHGGMSNAYTTDYETCYYLTVFTEGLMEMLDIFSRFFIDPLFLQDSVSREMNAVNNEHLKNINDDNWILEHFVRHVSDNKNKFTTGSLETLNVKNIREKMLEFYSKYYISDNISICIASKLDIVETEQMIIDVFSQIKKNRNEHHDMHDGITFSKKQDYLLKSIGEMHHLHYIWQIPEQISSNQYKTQEFQILGELIAVNKIGTLKFYLINNGYINGLVYDINKCGIFSIMFNLTLFGMENIDFIDSLLYKYLDDIYNTNISEIASNMNMINKINFDNLSKIDTLDLCNMLSSNHHYYESQNVYMASNIFYDIKETKHYVDIYKEFITHDAQIRILNTHNYSNETKMQKVPYYNSTFGIINLPINNKSYNIKLNTYDINKNLYIDTKPTIVTDLDIYNKPYLLPHETFDKAFDAKIWDTKVWDTKVWDTKVWDTKVWYGGNSKFNEPNVMIEAQFIKSGLFANAKHYILNHMVCKILNYLASIILLDGFKLGYNMLVTVNSMTSAIMLNISCLNDISKMKLFIQQITTFILDMNINIKLVSDEYINNILYNYKIHLKNISKCNSAEYNKYILSLLMNANEFSYTNLVDEIESITAQDIYKYIDVFIKDSALTVLIFGNITPENSNNVLNYFINKLSKYTVSCNKIPSTITPFWLCDEKICPIYERTFALRHPNKDQKSNSIMKFYHIGKFNPKRNVLLYMVIDILHDAFFDELRTKKQLGYLVKMYNHNYLDNHFIIQHIQSNEPVGRVLDEINKFNIITIMNFLQKDKFDEFKERIIAIINENDTSLLECYERYNKEIMHKTFIFSRKEILNAQIAKITFDDLVNFIKTFINDKNCIDIIIKGN
jgi:insulysin